MPRVQIQLTEHQLDTLKSLARANGQAVSEAAREAIAEWVSKRERDALWDQALAALGGFHSGLTDLGEKHDDYLGEDGRW